MNTIDVINPLTLKKLYSIEETSQEQVDKIFSKAKQVQKQVRKLTVDDRVKEVLKIRDYVIENREDLLDKIIAENGKSRLDGFTSEMFEIADVIDVFRKLAPKALKPTKVKTPMVLMGKKSEVWHEPLGTVLIITPWNYPLFQVLVPSILSFLAGNATVVKPSEETPLKGVVEEILEKSGFAYPDAIQIAYGTGITGQRLIDAKPNKINFTGSSNTGKKIMASASKHLIPVELELGGKDALIVFDDVNIERVVNGVMWGALTTSGQSCTSAERVYVHENIYDKFVEELTKKVKQIRVVDENTDLKDYGACDLGCITTDEQLQIIKNHLKDAEQKGAKILCGGTHDEGRRNLKPAVVVDVNHDMDIMTEETFGPVIPVMKFKTEEEAIELANDSQYGLGGSVWSKDLKRAKRVASQIYTGNLSINNHMLNEGNPNLPFGGAKQSGFGKAKGVEGLYGFCNNKSVLIDKDSKIIDPNWFPYTKTKHKLLSIVLDSHFSKNSSFIKFALAGLKLDSIGNKEKLK